MRALWHWVRRLRDSVDDGQVDSAFTRVVLPGHFEGTIEGKHFRLEMEGPIHRVGLPTETLATLRWPAKRGTQSDISSIFDQSQEWAGLLSIAFNRRVEALEEIFTHVLGVEYSLVIPACDRIDSTLMAPLDADTDASAVNYTLNQVLSLAPEDHDAISAAIQMHYSACLLSTRETNAAYALTVGALELLAKRFGPQDDSWEAWSESTRWEGTFRKAKLDEEQKARMRKAILADSKHRNLKRNFVEYVASTVPLAFWSEQIPEWTHEFDAGSGTITGGHWEGSHPRFLHNPTDSQIRKALQGAYEARSEYVHTGKRVVSLANESMIKIRPTDAKRLPFMALRSALRFAIETELTKRAKPFDMPKVYRDHR
ncbi:hypothetical protein SUDANB95_05620 [Actinosynnema sp. ALI-1.44]